ncbi:MAG: T9SS type A sorting domain-containing protein [Bacteroidota bacterium]
MKFRLTILLAFLAFPFFINAQSLMWSEGFETDGSGGARYTVYPGPNGFDDGGDDFFMRGTDATFSSLAATPTGEEGSFYFATEDTDDNGNADTDGCGCVRITSNPINVTGKTLLEFRGSFAAMDLAKFENFNIPGSDYIRVQYNMDGGGWNTIGQITAYDGPGCAGFCNDNDSQGELRADSDMDGEGDQTGTLLAFGIFQEFSYIIPTAGDNVQIRIEIVANNNSEEIAFDDLQLWGSTNLPIELTSFEGVDEGDYVKLFWKTQTELNNRMFVLQRSINATNWRDITEITGAGTTQTPQSYDYADYSPFPGNNYYRLMQVDFDGEFSYSPVILVKTDEVATEQTIDIFPNPSKGSVTLALGQRAVQLNVFDAITGQQLRVMDGFQGSQIADFSDLGAGMYLIQAIMEDGTSLQQKMVLTN